MDWTIKLFKRIEARYPGRWFDVMPTQDRLGTAMAEWATALAGCTGDQIKRGLLALGAHDSDWPPSVGAFNLMCRPNWQPASTTPIYKALPRPEVDVAMVAQELAKAKNANSVKGVKRSIYSPGYGIQEHEAACAKAVADGKPLYYVDMEAMARNGWTEDREAGVRETAKSMGWPVSRLYKRNHEPSSADRW